MRPVCSDIAGEIIETALTIIDLNGKGLSSMLEKDMKKLIEATSKSASDYYPETMGNTFIVNAPVTFRATWTVIKGFIDEKTRSKIKIIGKDYTKTLLEYVDAEKLPKFLGGECECEGGCLYAQPGPWHDYEIDGDGVKKRDSADGAAESIMSLKGN